MGLIWNPNFSHLSESVCSIVIIAHNVCIREPMVSLPRKVSYSDLVQSRNEANSSGHEEGRGSTTLVMISYHSSHHERAQNQQECSQGKEEYGQCYRLHWGAYWYIVLKLFIFKLVSTLPSALEVGSRSESRVLHLALGHFGLISSYVRTSSLAGLKRVNY